MNTSAGFTKSMLVHPSVPSLSKLLEMCLDHMSDAIVITEAEPFNQPGPRIVWVNKIFYERNGHSPEEVIGNTPRMRQGPGTDRATLDRGARGTDSVAADPRGIAELPQGWILLLE